MFYKIIAILISFLMMLSPAWAKVSQGAFYIGTDVIKSDYQINTLDNSIPQSELAKDRYYGYKYSNRGFFIAPEIYSLKSNVSPIINAVDADDKMLEFKEGYNIKANIGYEFNKYFAGFIMYDVARLSYDIEQRSAEFKPTKSGNATNIGIGSQVNFSSGFGIKVMYNKEQYQGSTQEDTIENDVIKFGTFYSF